jgi:hypothetical protein
MPAVIISQCHDTRFVKDKNLFFYTNEFIEMAIVCQYKDTSLSKMRKSDDISNPRS